MSPRQRRGMLLIGVAAVGAVGVFVMMWQYLEDVRSQLGPMVTVVAAADDLPPLATPGPEDLVATEVPQRWLPPNSVRDPAQIGDRVTAAAVPSGTVLSEGMFLERPAIEPGERELAILVDAETGVGGKLTSGAVVDIFATFGGEEGVAPSSRIVVQRAEIIEVGSPVDTGEGDGGPGSVGFGSGERLPVTFRLSVEDARTLTYVETFAASLRLGLRSPLDDEILPGDVTVFSPEADELGRLVHPVPRTGEVTGSADADDAADAADADDAGDDAADDEPAEDDAADQEEDE